MADAKKQPVNEETVETVKVKGSQLMDKVKEILHEGNVRKLTITDKTGRTILAVPLTIGVIGIFAAPTLAMIAAAATLLTECTITIERKADVHKLLES